MSAWQRPLEERLLCPRDNATRAGLSYHAVLRAIHRGDVRAFRVCGRIRVRPADVDAWIEASPVVVEGENFSPSPLFPSGAQTQRGSLADLRALEGGGG
jgi:excisionase family DNA binding protein